MSNKFSSPVLILGSERSGTNLLRALLSSHSKIISPPPAGFVDALGSIQSQYEPGKNKADLIFLIEDVITLTTTHHNPWNITLDSDVIAERLKAPTLWEIFRVVNELYAEQNQSLSWCSKEPGLFKYISEISENLPSAKFLYLVRDGRDVAASMLRGHLHEFHVYSAAQNWAWSQKLCLDALASPDLTGRVHLVKYERLIENPEEVMREVMKFVGFEFEKTQLQYYKNEKVLEHSKKSRFWKNLSQPIDGKNKGGYRKALGVKNTEVFESIAWEEMEALDYQIDSSQRKEITDFEIYVYQAIAQCRKFFWSLDPSAEASRNRARTKATQEIINRRSGNKV